MAKEQVYQKKIVKYLEEMGAYVVKVVTATKKGVPDLLVCYKGCFIAIEVKTPLTRSNTTHLQDHNLKKVKSTGGYAVVAVDVEDVMFIIQEIDNES